MTTSDVSSDNNFSDRPVADRPNGREPSGDAFASPADVQGSDTDATVTNPNADKHVQTTEPERAVSRLVIPKFALVVDGHRGNRLRLEVRLLTAGVRAKTFATGDAAMKSLLADELDMPDVIILGDGSASLDGLQIIKYVKRTPHAAKIPLLHYCIKDGELCVVQARTLGAVGSGSAAFDAVDLNEVLTRLKLSNRTRNAPKAGGTRLDDSDAEVAEALGSDATELDLDATDDDVAARLKALQSQVDEAEAHLAARMQSDDYEQPDSDHEYALDDSKTRASDFGVSTAGTVHGVVSQQRGIEGDVEVLDGDEPHLDKDELVSQQDDDPFVERPHKRLVDSENLKGLMSSSASNDSESFREHTSVVAYLRSLERRGRQKSPGGRRVQPGVEHRRRRTARHAENPRGDVAEKSSESSGKKRFGLESQRLEFQERLDRSFESLQHQFEYEMMRQTGAMQEHLGALLDAQIESIRDELLTTRHQQRVDRWLRILVIVVLVMMPALWVLTDIAVQPAPVAPVAHSESDESQDIPVADAAAQPDVIEMPLDGGLSSAERLRVTQSVEQLLNAGATPNFGSIALGVREAARLEQALEMLTVIDYQGVVQVINHVSPYCVQYDGSGKASLDLSEEAITQCFMSPENVVAAQSQATEQSVEFGNLLSRYNREDVPIKVVVIPAVAEGDFWSVTETFAPSATGEELTARDWNDRARSRNRIEYRLLDSAAVAGG